LGVHRRSRVRLFVASPHAASSIAGFPLQSLTHKLHSAAQQQKKLF